MTAREDMSTACELMLRNAWLEITSEAHAERGRHRVFTKKEIVLEIHAFFASMNDPVKAKTFDDLIIDNINSSHVLPDLINGLVLIDHINQHLEAGVGLRQIIDWMLFVDKCLPDERWVEFLPLARTTGFETLAITTTRMCEIFLGLPEHKWCKDASEQLCSDFMEYIMRCGDFGKMKDSREESAVVRVEKLKHPFLALKELQQIGEKNWEYADWPVMKHLAWAWQGVQTLKRTSGLMPACFEAWRRDRMFEALGVKRNAKGLVTYKDGVYMKG